MNHLTDTPDKRTNINEKVKPNSEEDLQDPDDKTKQVPKDPTTEFMKDAEIQEDSPPSNPINQNTQPSNPTPKGYVTATQHLTEQLRYETV